MIETDSVEKSYRKKKVLRGISFRAEPSAITLFVGPNGAGKSTTLKVLAGLIRLNGGVARVNGFDVVSERIKAQRSLAYLPQSLSFHPRLTCLQVPRFYAGLRGVAKARCDSMPELTGLTEAARMRPGTLSGVTRPLVGLALLRLADATVLVCALT